MYFSKFQDMEYDIEGNGTLRTVKNIAQYSDILTKNIDDISFYTYYNVSDGERPDNVSEKLYGTSEFYWTLFMVNKTFQNTWTDWPKKSSALRSFLEEQYIGYAGIFAAADDISNKFTIGETITGATSGAVGKLLAKYTTAGWVQIELIGTTKFSETGEAISGANSEDILSCTSIIRTPYAPSYHTDDSSGERVKRRDAGTTGVSIFSEENQKNLDRARIKVIKPEYINEIANAFEEAMRQE